MPPIFHPLANIFPSRNEKRSRSFRRRDTSVERIPLVAIPRPAGSVGRRESFGSDSTFRTSPLHSSPSSPSPSPNPRPPFTRSSSSSSSSTSTSTSTATTPLINPPPRKMKTSRLSLTSVTTIVAVLGLLGDNGLSNLGIVGVSARAVPYTAFEERGGRSQWEGSRMREVEGLRVRGVSEKEIAAHFSTPHPRTRAYPQPVAARSAGAEPEPAPEILAETKTRFENFVHRVLERIGVSVGQHGADASAMEGAALERAEEENEKRGKAEAEEKRAVEERDAAAAETRKQGEVQAREEMKQWLQARDAEIGGVGAVEDREEEMEERAEGAEGVGIAVAVKRVVATGEAMAEKRAEEEDEMPELQVQKRMANDAEEVVRNVLEEWRRNLGKRSAAVNVAAAAEVQGVPLGKRSIAMDAENGGLEVRGQMGRLKALQV